MNVGMNQNASEMTRRQISEYAMSMMGLKSRTRISSNASEVSVFCPFHRETNPSCFIDVDRGIYHCFSCGRGGSIESLYREVTGDSLYKAMGISNDPFSSFARRNFRYGFDYGESSTPSKKNIYINYDESAMVPASSEKKCLEYLHRRGISSRMADEYGMFYCRESRINTTLFRNRICIPIYEGGRLMSIEGRRLNDEDEPKVLYPRNTSVDLLYNIDNLKRDETLYACEGLMDLFVLKGCSFFSNSTSIFGANPTRRQIQQLGEFRKVVYINDLDEAGERTLEALKKSGLDNIYNLRLPSEVNGKKIKDIGDLPGAGISPQDLLNRKWLSYMRKV